MYPSWLDPGGSAHSSPSWVLCYSSFMPVPCCLSRFVRFSDWSPIGGRGQRLSTALRWIIIRNCLKIAVPPYFMYPQWLPSGNSLGYALITVLLSLTLGYPAAAALAHPGQTGTNPGSSSISSSGGFKCHPWIGFYYRFRQAGCLPLDGPGCPYPGCPALCHSNPSTCPGFHPGKVETRSSHAGSFALPCPMEGGMANNAQGSPVCHGFWVHHLPG